MQQQQRQLKLIWLRSVANAYAADILQTEQRLQSEDLAPVYTTDADREKGRGLLRERLQLLRQKTAELTRSRKSQRHRQKTAEHKLRMAQCLSGRVARGTVSREALTWDEWYFAWRTDPDMSRTFTRSLH